MRSPLLIIAFSLFVSSDAQTIYRFKFKSPELTNATVYDAYFSVSSNGTGFTRIRSGNTIVEAKISEQFPIYSDGNPDTSILIYETSDPVVVKGNKSSSIPPFVFWFKLNSQGFPDPTGVSIGNKEPNYIEPFSNAEFIRSQDLVKNKSTVLQFFADTSSYFKNYFGPKSKGGSLTPEEKKNTRMFMIVVASTADSTLMPNCTIDARKFVDLFSDIAKNVLGIRYFVDSIYGDQYNKPAVQTAISKLRPGPNDIVIFYYTGHGFTDREYKDKEFPFLDLRNPNKRPRPDARTQTLNIQDIYDSIINKKARCNLIFSDCCNDTIEAKKGPGPKPPGQKGLTKANFDNVKALFMSKTKINLLMTAASKDERAIITPSYSSYFTHFLVESLKTYMSPEKSAPNWFQVLAEAQKQTKLYAARACCRQTPKLLLPK